MIVTVFGATGPTGLRVCELASAAGHEVRATSRRGGTLAAPGLGTLPMVRADAATGEGVAEAVAESDAVLSVLGVPYTRKPVSVYSAGAQAMVEALRRSGRGQRLVVVSSGMTYPPPPGLGFVPDRIVFPILRNIVGRTLYADMRRMEELLLAAPDIAWTVVRPGRLFNAPAVSPYRVDENHPSQGYTSRIDLAAAMVAELDPATAHVHQAIAPTTTR